jgi:hypothetical protein
MSLLANPRDLNARRLRDRTLIALIICPFARIGAALGMTVEEFYTKSAGAAAAERRQAPRAAVPPQLKGIN